MSQLNGFSATACFRQRLPLIIISQWGYTHCNPHSDILMSGLQIVCVCVCFSEIKTGVKLPFLKLRVVLWVMLVACLLQGFVEDKSIFFININGSQVRASTKPPLLGPWIAQRGKEEGNKAYHSLICATVSLTPRQLLMSWTHHLPLRSQSTCS